METETEDRLQTLIQLYREGYRNPVIDQAVEKLVALEVVQAREELLRLQERLANFEETHEMTSSEFYDKFRSGVLGDEMAFVEWSSFWDMHLATQRRLDELTKASI